MYPNLLNFIVNKTKVQKIKIILNCIKCIRNLISFNLNAIIKYDFIKLNSFKLKFNFVPIFSGKSPNVFNKKSLHNIKKTPGKNKITKSKNLILLLNKKNEIATV